jgi:hypothetical protein
MIYLDDGRLIDVRGNNIREALTKAKSAPAPLEGQGK